jgi:hypothetical protein
MELTPEQHAQLQQQTRLMHENWERMRQNLNNCKDSDTIMLSSHLNINCDIFRQILIYRGENLANSLYSNELNVDEETRFVNEDVNPGLRENGTSAIDPVKWIQVIEFLRDSLRRPYQQPVASHTKQVASRGLEQSPDTHRNDMEIAMAMATANHADDIGFGGSAQPMLSPNEIARELAKKDINNLIREMLMITVPPRLMLFAKLTHHDETLEQMIAAHIAALKQRITAYLSSQTINLAVVNDLYEYYLIMFDRTNHRREDDMHWLDDPTQKQKDKIRIENSILDALAKFCGIKTGGKKSRSKKRGRKSIHRRKKSSHKKRK